MNGLILTVGLPRSGKSTWSAKYAKLTGAAIVNPDSIRLVLHGKAWHPDAEPMIWAIAKTMVKSLFMAGQESVILDATSGTRARRNDWLGFVDDISLVYFNTPKEECVRRAVAGRRPDLLPVIERMARDFQPPDFYLDPEELLSEAVMTVGPL